MRIMVLWRNNGSGEGKSVEDLSELESAEIRSRIEDLKDHAGELRGEEGNKLALKRCFRSLAGHYQELKARTDDPELAGRYSNKVEMFLKAAGDRESPCSGGEVEKVGVGGSSGGGDGFASSRWREAGKTFEDVAGMVDLKDYLVRNSLRQVRFEDLFKDLLNVEPEKGLVLHGPPGVGKSLIAEAFAGEWGCRLEEGSVSYLKISGAEVKDKFQGESQSHLKSVFEAAKRREPSVVVFEEFDALASSRDEVSVQKNEADLELVNALLDEINELDGFDVVCIGTTNYLDRIDDAVVQSHRFDDYKVSRPGEEARREILEFYLERSNTDWDRVDLGELAVVTEGFTGGDLERVVKKAGSEVGNDSLEDGVEPVVTQSYLLSAAEGVAGRSLKSSYQGVEFEQVDLGDGEGVS